MKKTLRFIRIYAIYLKYRLDEILIESGAFKQYSFLKYLNPFFWLKGQNQSRGVRIRLALIALGPIFVKFGQILSTRRDLLPDDIAQELILLQDKVPPFNNKEAQKIIEKSFKQTIDTLFKSFDLNPLASASIAQVHAATLKSGEEVVVKVLRPNIHRIILRDIELMKTLGRLIEKLWSEGTRLKPLQIVAEFEHSILNELDLSKEAGSASQLRRNFEGSNQLYVPQIFWEYCHPKVIVMERIHGTPIADIDSLKKQEVNLKKLADRGVEIFFTQVFRDCFFHADMHAGNIFVDTTEPNHPKYIAVDFGIMGTLDTENQHYLAYNLLAFFQRDYKRVALLHIESGWVPADTRVGEFEAAIRSVCEPIFEKPIKEISFGKLLLRLFQTAKQFNMSVQPQLLLLQKTLLNVEGLGRQLYPDLNLWETAKPYLEKWMKTQVGLKAFCDKARSRAPFWTAKLAELPDQLFDLLENQKNTKEYYALQRQSLQEVNKTLKDLKNQQLKIYGLFSILIIIGTLLLLN